MVIEFRDLEELALELDRKVDDIGECFDALFKHFDIRTNDAVKTRILKAQEKRKKESALFEKWANLNEGHFYSEDDFPADVVADVEQATGVSFSEACYGHIGIEITEETFYFPDIFRLHGKYYFSEKGIDGFMFYFMHSGWITEERYLQWQKDTGIDALT